MISYTEELYNTLTDNKDIINYLMNIKYNDITSYYESYFDRLIYYKKSLNKGNFLFDESNYKLLDKYLFKDEKGIVKCRDFMFHEDGNLILFQHAKKEIINITSAKEFMSDKIVSNFNLESYELNKYLDFLMNIDCDIKIGQLEDYCMEEFHKNISIKNMELFENSNDIKRIIQMRDRGIDRLNNIAAKQLIIIDKLQNLIIDIYDGLSLEDKKYIYSHHDDYLIKSNSFIDKKMDCIDCATSLNNKTNGLYSKYTNLIRMYYEQYYMAANPHSLIIKKEVFKNLVKKR